MYVCAVYAISTHDTTTAHGVHVIYTIYARACVSVWRRMGERASRKTNTFVIISLVYTIFLYSSFSQTKNQLHLFEAFLVYPIDIRCFVQYISGPLVYICWPYVLYNVVYDIYSTLRMAWGSRVEYARTQHYMRIIYIRMCICTLLVYVLKHSSFTQHAMLLLLVKKYFAFCIQCRCIGDGSQTCNSLLSLFRFHSAILLVNEEVGVIIGKVIYFPIYI